MLAAPLSPPFHPHSLVSDIRSVLGVAGSLTSAYALERRLVRKNVLGGIGCHRKIATLSHAETECALDATGSAIPSAPLKA